MQSTQPQQSESHRIKEAYARRDMAQIASRYSIFRKEQWLRIQELECSLIDVLQTVDHSNLSQERILEIGCGDGYWLRQFVQWGAKPAGLFGVDLVEERIRSGKSL